MECGPGKKYSHILKMCVSKGAFSASKGKSKSPCPNGRHWNAYTRKCIRGSLHKKLYGHVSEKPKSIKSKGRPNIVTSGKGLVEKANKSFMANNNTFMANNNTFMAPGLPRKSMLEWVDKNCKNKENPISLEPFIETEGDELSSIVKLGSGFCYPVEALDQHIKSSIERGIPVKDIMNPSYRLTTGDYGAIEHVGKRANKTYKLPKMVVVKPDEKYKLYIDKGDSSDFKFVFLFDSTKVKVGPHGKKEYIQAIPEGGWLGYIPSSGTEELEKLIKIAFQNGQLFSKRNPPFNCCKFHIKKSKDYWTTNTVAKIKSLEAEIRNYL